MWGNFKSYFVNCPTEEQVKENEDEEYEGWVIVDCKGNEIEKNTLEPVSLDSPRTCESRLNPLPLLDISNASSAQSSPQLSPTKIEEGWFVAPPPCFTLNCPSMIEISPLEDLLIEHPSMSVYSEIRNLESEELEEETTSSHQPAHDKPETRTCEHRSDIENNLMAKVCTKPHLNLKDLVDQTENMKPAQQAKWENEQYKLCPSYINRQNRVHRYQSRKHHNQKKKSVAKPFAEKGKHSF